MPHAMPIDEMGVHNVGFLIENLGKDAAPLQYLRELTQNAFEAIGRANRTAGQVEIDFELVDGVRKLRITDNGIGMTAEEVRENINMLSASGGEQAFDKNFGIGAKITAAVKNPVGIMYKAWKGGEGSLTILGRQDGRYGRVPWPSPNLDLPDQVVYSVPLPPEDKPASIEESGVSVVLLGQTTDQDTFAAPQGATPESQWIAAFLERRYFEPPKGITIKVMRSNPIHDAERGERDIYDTIRGQRYHLAKHCEASGIIPLPGFQAEVYWWLLNESIVTGGKHWNNRGHVGAVYQGELYEVRGGSSKVSALKDFGIYAGHGRIVIYVRPLNVIGPNAARSALIVSGGHGIDYGAIGEAFADKMPDELISFMSGQVTSEHTDHRKAILKALQEVESALEQARYRRSPRGRPDHFQTEPGGRAGRDQDERGPQRDAPRRTHDATGRVGTEYLRRAREEMERRQHGQRVDNTDPAPRFSWDEDGLSVMSGRAASYVKAGHRVVANAKCGFYEEMLEWAVSEGRSRASEIEEIALRQVCTEEVRRWFEQAITEAVVALRPLEFDGAWGPAGAQNALSEEALTTAVVSHRWHMMSAIKRGLAGRLGRVREHAPAA